MKVSWTRLKVAEFNSGSISAIGEGQLFFYGPREIMCNYCGGSVNSSVVEVKRPVPTGAVDLGLMDTKPVLRCMRCRATTDVSVPPREGVRRAFEPGQWIADEMVEVRPVIVTCLYCGRLVPSDGPFVEVLRVGGGEEVGYAYEWTWYHAEHLPGTVLDQFVARQWQWSSTRPEWIQTWKQLPNHLSQPFLERAQAIEQVRAEAERNRRVREGLCAKCGRKLGFLERLAGKHEHASCAG